MGEGSGLALFGPVSGLTRPIIRPPEAGAAQFRNVDIHAWPGYPPFREGND